MITLNIPSQATLIPCAGDYIIELAKLYGLSEAQCGELKLACIEAMNNIAHHAYQDDPNQRIGIQVSWNLQQFEVELTDQGQAMDAGLWVAPVSTQPAIDDELALLSENGRGILIIRAYTDAVHYLNKNGSNHLRLSKKLRR